VKKIHSQHILAVCQTLTADFAALGYSATWSGQFWHNPGLAFFVALAERNQTGTQTSTWQLTPQKLIVTNGGSTVTFLTTGDTEQQLESQAPWVIHLSECFAHLHYLLEPTVPGLHRGEISYSLEFWLEGLNLFILGVDPRTADLNHKPNLHRLELRLVQTP
jgi:hypothetical protein